MIEYLDCKSNDKRVTKCCDGPKIWVGSQLLGMICRSVLEKKPEIKNISSGNTGGSRQIFFKRVGLSEFP
jgi:hypothetical protein